MSVCLLITVSYTANTKVTQFKLKSSLLHLFLLYFVLPAFAWWIKINYYSFVARRLNCKILANVKCMKTFIIVVVVVVSSHSRWRSWWRFQSMPANSGAPSCVDWKQNTKHTQRISDIFAPKQISLFTFSVRNFAYNLLDYLTFGIIYLQFDCYLCMCMKKSDVCRCSIQILGGAVGERVAESAHCSVWNVVSSERHSGGLGGR